MKNIRGNQWSKYTLAGVASVLAMGLAAPSAAAQSAQSAQAETGERAFSAPAGPLGRTLIVISNAYGVDVVGANDLVAGRSAPAVSGVFTVEEALTRALGGTGLTFARSQTGAYVVTQQTVEALPPQRRTAREDLLATDTVVVTGRRAPRPISEIPNSVSVIQKEEITAQFAVDENISSALAFSVPGFAPRSSTVATNPALRGRTALILIDGVPQHTLIRTSVSNIESLPPEAIERIEVLRGANAVFGFGASGGVVNYITQRAPDEGHEFAVKARTVFQTSDVEPSKEIYGRAAGRFGDLGVLVGVGYDDLSPSYAGDGSLLPNQEALSGRNILNVHGAIDYDISPTQRLLGTVTLMDRTEDLGDFTVIDSVGDPATETFATARFADAFFTDFVALFDGGDPVDPSTLPYDLEAGVETLLNATLSYQNDDVLGSSVEIVGLFHNFRNIFSWRRFSFIDEDLQDRRRRKRLGVRTNIDTPLSFINDGARIVWGADYISSTIDESINLADRVTGEIFEGTKTTIRLSPFTVQNTLGLWAGVEIPFRDFLLSGGVRYDDINADLSDAEFDFGGLFAGGDVNYSATLYNAGVVYYPAPNVDVYFSFSQGFDVTDIGRAAFDAPSADLIDPEPAITNNYELGLRARLGAFSGSLAAFYADSDLASRLQPNPIVEGGLLLPLRQPERVWGVEAAWTYQAREDLDFGGIFAYNEGERELEDGEVAPIQNQFISPIKITAYANWSPTSWFDGRVQLSQDFESNRFDGSTEFGEGDFENLTLVDALLRFKDDQYGALDVGVDNLFNVVDAAPGDRAFNGEDFFFPIPGRTISLTYRYEFGR